MLFDSLLELNEAECGGAMYVRARDAQTAHVHFNGCGIHQNNATRSPLGPESTNDGGGLSIGATADSAVAVSFAASNLTRNAAAAGGAISIVSSTNTTQIGLRSGMLYSSTLVLGPGVRLVGNSATGSGGAVFAQGRVQLLMSNGVDAANNSAGRSGGALAMQADSSARIQHIVRLRQNAAASGGAVALAGGSRLVLGHGVLVTANTGNQGGAIFASVTSSVKVLDGVRFSDNSATASGGAFYVRDNTTIVVDPTSASAGNTTNADLLGGLRAAAGLVLIGGVDITNNTAGAKANGGAFFMLGDSNVTLQGNVTVRRNAALDGGAAVINDNSRLVIGRGVLVTGNTGHQGGAIHATEASFLTLLGGARLTDNEASDFGGAVFLNGNSSLSIKQGVEITRNKAAVTGGGLWLGSRNFFAAAVIQATRNNTAPNAANYDAEYVRLELLNGTDPVVVTSRVDATADTPHFFVKSVGFQGIPSSMDIQAKIQDLLVTANKTQDGTGVALLKIPIRKPPGDYNLTFFVEVPVATFFVDKPGTTVTSITMLVTVRPCPMGDVVASTGDACITCVAGSFSMNPANNTCDACPGNALCPGSWAVLPTNGFWSSSPYSIQMHR